MKSLKVIAVLMALMMACCLFGCSGNDGGDTTAADTTVAADASDTTVAADASDTTVAADASDTTVAVDTTAAADTTVAA